MNAFGPAHYLSEKDDAVILEGVQRNKRYHPLRGGGSSELGCLMCSRYRISFLCGVLPPEVLSSASDTTVVRPPHTTLGSADKFTIFQDNMIGQNDILVSTINSIILWKRGVRHAINSSNFSEELTKCYLKMELNSVDFSIYEFEFFYNKEAPNARLRSMEIINFLNVLVRYTFPLKSQALILSKDVRRESLPTRIERVAYTRQIYSNWMNGSGGAGSSLCDFNLGYRNANQSLPPLYLVPIGWYASDVAQFAQIVDEYRGPVFCCSSPVTGRQLLRSARFQKSCEPKELLTNLSKKIATANQKSDPSNQSLKVIQLNKVFPTLAAIQDSHNKLRELCQPDNQLTFETNDSRWLQDLEATRWLSHVSQTLQETCNILNLLTTSSGSNTEYSVLIVEPYGRDMTCLVSSLIQICMFSDCRQRNGFEALVDREWVQMGHEFPRRYEHWVSPPSALFSGTKTWQVEYCPVFALFIDCVYQLLHQFPLEFDFTEDYLLILADAAGMSCFLEFSLSSEFERGLRPGIRSVWHWERFLTTGALALFNNPLYQLSRHHPDSTFKPMSRSLQPCSSLSSLDFWEHAYFRWVNFLHLRHGGSANTACRLRELAKILLDNQTGSYGDKLSASLVQTSGFPFTMEEPMFECQISTYSS